jgi:hypothetical protein
LTVDIQKKIENLTIFDATMIAEGNGEMAGVENLEDFPELQLAAWQKLVDTGVVWQLQGCFGRQAQAMIDDGLISGGGQ